MDATQFSYQHPESGEWAHDLRDPVAEADHSFVGPAWDVCPPQAGQELHILEIGFGRGINTARALWRLAEEGWQGAVRCLGLEAFPEHLQPWPTAPPEIRPWSPWWGADTAGAWQFPDRPWSGRVGHRAAPAGIPATCHWDWIFVDLFSPARHAADWAPGLFRTLRQRAAPHAVLTSYCCARPIRERLQVAAWQTEVLRRRGRRDTLRARPASLRESRFTPTVLPQLKPPELP